MNFEAILFSHTGFAGDIYTVYDLYFIRCYLNTYIKGKIAMSKYFASAFIIGLISLLPLSDEVSARGPGGGGGGHPGGMGGSMPGAGGGMNRFTPNFSPSINPYGAADNFSRSNITPGNRAGIGQLQGVGQGLNAIQHSTINNIQGFNKNQFGMGNAPNRMNYGNWYHGNWHGPWNQPWHPHPVAWWTAGYMTGWAVASAPWAWGYWPYYNPYFTSEMVVTGTYVDYSQPIVTASLPGYVIDAQSTASQLVMNLFDDARKSFSQGDYNAALSQINKAIAKMPNDTVLHQFRGLALFALGRYQESAAAVYAVLSIGPGWDADTMNDLYPNRDVYAEQLRALEQYSRENPKSAESHFLLAYHYLTAGNTDAALREFKNVVSLNPNDQLSAQLLASLSTPVDAEQPKPDAPAVAVAPVDPARLPGIWKTTRPDGSTITLILTTDRNYSWKFTQKDKIQEFSGPYTVADNLLILKKENNPVMVGQVTPLTGNRFNFKLAGDNPNDPGLTFVK
jgi:hypothetical protein